MYFLAEYQCQRCHERFESLEDSHNIPQEMGHICDPRQDETGTAIRVPSAVQGTMKMSSAITGRTEPPPPNTISTKELADGMSRKEWNKRRRKKIREARIDEIRSKI
jgi:hypothetical protein